MSKSRVCGLAILLVIIAGLGFIGSSAMADDDESSEKTVARNTLPQESLDSLYQLINARYESVRPIFEYSCFDCHSARTEFPWYHRLPIIKGILDDHVKEGREKLDFTNGFPFGTKDSQLGLLHEIKEEIEDDEMPLFSYRLMHWGRLIEGEKRDSVFAWIDAATALLSAAGNGQK